MIGFTGPRKLDPIYGQLVRDVLHAVKHFGVAVGCASGLDSIVTRAHDSSFNLDIFAVFDSDGRYAVNSSNVDGVLRAEHYGATVHWASGGRSGNVNKMLSNRSLAMITAVANSKARKKGIIGFPDKALTADFNRYGQWYSCHSGTWGTIASAEAIGLPVVVFKCGDFELPQLTIPGEWIAGKSGVWIDSWKYVRR